MFEVKDIKLFGKTIELPETLDVGEAAQSCDVDDSSNQDPPCSSNSMIEDSSHFNGDSDELESDKILSNPKQDDTKAKDQPQPLMSEEVKDSNTTPPPPVENSKTQSSDSDAGPIETSKNDEDHNEDTSNSQDKTTLKKPDKIIPCPRCNSMETKFCYFNNYNVNQPRHFCKKCQRYWTAGGTMRNVPVGAGRRKNKNAPSQFRHITIPESSAATARVLTFSSDAPLSESMVSVMNIADKTRNGFQNQNPVEQQLVGEDQSSGSSVTNASSKDEVGIKNGLPQMIPVFPGAPWPYPWNFGPFYPTVGPQAYWACAMPGSWNVPWVIPQTTPSSLGKHPRDEKNVLDEERRKGSDPEKCLWVPKTLRIDDPDEAAKSSIWDTLGIKNDGVGSIGGGGGLFKAFRSPSNKGGGGDEKSRVPEPSSVLQANPAALSRSLSFHERS